MAGEKPFTLRLSGEGATLDTAVSIETARRIFNLVLAGNTVLPLGGESADEALEGDPSPKQFMGEKRPGNDVERIVCLAYYLAHYRQKPRFKTEDLTSLNRDAAQPSFSNASATARNATTYHYLSLAGGGEKQITARGEELVKALPDRAKVKEALEAHPAPRRHKKRPRVKETK